MKTIIQFIIKAFILLSYLISVYCQQCINNNVPFVYIVNTGRVDSNVVVDYSGLNLKQTPEVIVGINHFFNNWKPNTEIDFYLSSESTTLTSSSIKITKPNITVFEIRASVLVIDKSQFPYIEVIDTTDTFTLSSSSKTKTITKTFSSNIQSISGTKKVIAILRGWKQDKFQGTTRFALNISVISSDDTGYQIQFQTTSNSMEFYQVYYTIVEYISNPLDSIYGIESYYETSLISQALSNNEYPVTITPPVPFCSSVTPTNNFSNLFVSATKFDYKTKQGGQDPYVDIRKFSITDQNTISFSYQFNTDTQSSGTTSYALLPFKLQCSDSEQKIQKRICINGCINVDPVETSLCIDCLNSNEYFLKDTNVCTNITPSTPPYLCSPEKSYQACYTCSMIPNCKECELNSDNKLVCTQCDPATNTYLYEGVCSSQKPDNTYCDSTKICKQCTDPLCNDCKDPDIQEECNICFSNKYLYQLKCYSQQPEHSYCSNYQCQQCIDPRCKFCTDPSQTTSTCTDCLTNDYIYDGKCYTLPVLPNNVFCDMTEYKCYQCNDIMCKTCSDPRSSAATPSKCVTCQTGDYFYDGKCYISTNLPNNTYCDDQNFNCYACQDSDCKSCSDTRGSNKSVCLSCQNLDYLYEGKCYKGTSLPYNTYCDTSSFLCYKCLDPNCKSCSDPQTNSGSPSICLTCSDGVYLYEGKCYSQNNLPDNTFCDNTNFHCYKCLDTSCKTCTDPRITTPKTICDSCRTGDYMYDGVCYGPNSLPDNTYCDKNTLVCYKCVDASCKSCTDPRSQFNSQNSICVTCRKDDYFYKGVCYLPTSLPDNTYCDNQDFQCYVCIDPECKQCTNSKPLASGKQNSDSICLSCLNNYYMYEGKCYQPSNLPDNTFCDSTILSCFTCINERCKICSDTRITNSSNKSTSLCTTCYQDDYFYEGQCYPPTSLPDNTYCDPPTMMCYKCVDPTCKSCSDPRHQIIDEPNNSILNPSKCLSCFSGYKLRKIYCKIPLEASETVSNTAKSTAILSLASLSSGQVQMFLSLQKLNLLAIMDVEYIEELSVFMETIRGTNPLNYLKQINFLSKYLFIESEQSEKEQILTDRTGQTSLLINAGGVFILIIVIAVLQVSLILLSKYLSKPTTNTNSPKYLLLLQKVVCYIFFQLNELITLIAGYALFLQIIGFMHLSGIDFKAVKIIMIIIIFIYQILLFIYYFKLLNQANQLSVQQRSNHSSPNNSFSSETQSQVQFSYKIQLFELLLSDNIYVNYYTRNFQILYSFVENIMIPFAIIVFYDNYIVQCSICITLQFILFIISMIVRPSQEFLKNVRLTIDQVCWTLIFILVLVYGTYAESYENTDILVDGDETLQKYSKIIKIVIMIALYLNPFILALHFIISIPKYIKMLKEMKLKRLQEIEYNRFVNLINNYKSFKIHKPNLVASDNTKKEFLNFENYQRLCNKQTLSTNYKCSTSDQL